MTTKTLRVRTKEEWDTKPVEDLPANRLIAEEIDDNFLALEGQIENKANKNYVINGSFNVWQRGTSFTDTLGVVYTADRWSKSTNAGVVHEQVVPIGGVSFRDRLVLSANNKAFVQIVTRIESQHVKELAGKTVTLSCWMRKDTDVAESDGRFMWFNYPTDAADDFSALTYILGFAPTTPYNVWKKHTFTYELPEACWKGLQINIRAVNDVANTITYSIANVKLELGSVATPFEEEDPTTELLQCQHYYWRGSPPGGNWPGRRHATADALLCIGSVVQFPVPMRASPTVSLVSGTYEECAHNDFAISQQGFHHRVNKSVNSGGYRITSAIYQADAEL